MRPADGRRGAIMDMGGLDAAVMAWLEAMRGWMMQQGWLGFARDGIRTAEPWAIWMMVASPAVLVILIVGFWWPVRRAD